MRRALVLAILACGGLAAIADARVGWPAAVESAKEHARTRAGSVAFAIIDEAGRMRGSRRDAGWYSASLLKPVVLGAYLRRRSVRSRGLSAGERALLAPMIRRSANEPANRLVPELGTPAIRRFGRRLGLTGFRPVLPIWGTSHITAGGYASFFRSLPEALPDRHRAYGRRLLRTVVASQRWGVPAVAPGGWRVLLKGGWRAGRGYGRIVNQAARLECGARVVTLVVLTDRGPSHGYGTDTVRGVARRLLRPLGPCGAAQ